MSETAPIDLNQLIDQVEACRPDTALAAIACATQVAADMGALVDRLIGYYVERARAEGHSWAEIGAFMGISRQAAQQRFGARQASLGLADLEEAGGLQRFTTRAREALRRAEAEARNSGDDSITPTHLLGAILADENSLATRATARVGMKPAALRRLASGQRRSPKGPEPKVVTVDPALRRALTNSVSEALQLGHNYVGTEHLLLGLIRDPDSWAAEAFAAHGVGVGQIREAVRQLLDMYLRERS